MLEPYRPTSTISTTTSHRPNPSFWRRARSALLQFNPFLRRKRTPLHPSTTKDITREPHLLFIARAHLCSLPRFSCGLVCAAARTRWLDDADLDLPSHTIYGVGLCWPGMGEPPLFLPTCWPSRLQTCCPSCKSVEQPICSALAVRWSTIRA